MQEQHWSLHTIGAEDRRIFQKQHRFFPETAPYATLCVFILKLPWQTRPPAYAAIGACHIGNRRSCFCGFESGGLRDHISNLITAPAMPLNADGVLIHKSFINHRLNSWQNTFQGTLPRMPYGVNNIGHQDQIAVTNIKRGVDIMTRLRWRKTMQAIRQFLID